MFSAVCLALMIQVGKGKTDAMAPLTVSLYNLSLSPRRIQAPEARSDLWREAVGLSTSTLCCQPTGSLVRGILFVVTAVHSRQETLGKEKKKKKGKGEKPAM